MFSDPSLLDRASRLVFHLNRVPHLVTRLHCHEIPFSWFGFCSSVFAQLRIVQVACDEVGNVTVTLRLKFLPHVASCILISFIYITAA